MSTSSTSSRPSSVRGLYTPPAEEWVFLPPSISPSSQPAQSSSPPPPAHLPTPFFSSDDAADPASASPGLYSLLQLFAAEYLTTAIGMPFEVGKTLLQVEYRPRARFAPPVTDQEEALGEEGKERDWGAEDDELSNPEEADVYFTDRLAAPSTAFVPGPAPSTLAAPDSSGYLPDLHPGHLLLDSPDISRSNGVWGMIRRIRSTPSEGLPGLWKSQLLSTVHSLLTNLLQPNIHSFLLPPSSASAINVDMPLSALPHPAMPLAFQVASHLVTHLLLSPLELVRTRLIVAPLSQSPSSLGLLRQAIEEEGGIAGLYLHPNLLIPTLLEHTLRPLLTLSVPLLLERHLGITPELSPITYSLCDLSLGLASLVVLLPIETVRKRLQVQPRGRARRHKTVVKVREAPYVGVVEGIWRILSEETGARRKRNMTEKDEGGIFSGVRQLYRGFGMAAATHLTVFGLGLVSAGLGGSGLDGGWKEI